MLLADEARNAQHKQMLNSSRARCFYAGNCYLGDFQSNMRESGIWIRTGIWKLQAKHLKTF